MKKLILITIISMLILSTTTTVFGATNLTELNEEFPNFEQTYSNYENTYPYYVLVKINSIPYMLLYDNNKFVVKYGNYSSTGVNADYCFYITQNTQYLSLKYDGAKWVNNWSDTFTTGFEHIVHASGNVIPLEQFQYSNSDIYDSDGKMVFRKARYPLTTIKGQISSKTITATTLNPIKTLIVFLMGCLISVVAFRKAWAMLRTILSGA